MVSAAMTAAAVAEPAEAREYLQRGCSTRDGALCAASGRGEEGEGGGGGRHKVFLSMSASSKLVLLGSHVQPYTRCVQTVRVQVLYDGELAA